MESDLHPIEDVNERFFIFPEFLAAGPLDTDERVWDYFRSSLFWDNQCNNAILDMQTMYTLSSGQDREEQLKRFTGIEFALVHSDPPSFWVFHKRERLSPDEVRVLNVYFVMHDIIIPAPDVYTVLSNRLYSTVSALQRSLDTLRACRPDYAPHTGYVWPIGESTFSDAATEDKKADLDTQEVSANKEPDISAPTGPISRLMASGSKKQQNHMLLYNAMMATGAHQRLTDPAGKFASAVANMQASDAQGASSQSTPAAVPQTPTVPPAPSKTPILQEPAAAKGIPGAGKKKRKSPAISFPHLICALILVYSFFRNPYCRPPAKLIPKSLALSHTRQHSTNVSKDSFSSQKDRMDAVRADTPYVGIECITR